MHYSSLLCTPQKNSRYTTRVLALNNKVTADQKTKKLAWGYKLEAG